MLKWTVIGRRDAEKSEALRLTSLGLDANCTPSKAKRRRSSVARRSSTSRRSRNSLNNDKENQFTSTPLKNHSGDPLKDVGNLTPQNRRGGESKKRTYENISSPFGSTRKHKKKKECRTSIHKEFFYNDDESGDYFKNIESVDSHIKGVLDDDFFDEGVIRSREKARKRVPDMYAPTLPTFVTEYSPCLMRTTHCLNTLSNRSLRVTPLSKILSSENDHYPPEKRPKIDHVNDFLHQISCIASPEDNRIKFSFSSPTYRPVNQTYVKVSPLVRKLVDLKFNNCDSNTAVNNDSSYINDLSIDKLVDALLETSHEEERVTNFSLGANIDQDTLLPQTENQFNESQEQNLINMEVEKRSTAASDRCSSDSGFRSSATENSHQLDINFTCKCNKKSIPDQHSNNETVINLQDTYNERCVDDSRPRKRHLAMPYQDDYDLKLTLNQYEDDESSFTLQRRQCIRRKRNKEDRLRYVETIDKDLRKPITENDVLNTSFMDVSQAFSDGPLFHSSKLSRSICRDTKEDNEDLGSLDCFKRTRRCLLFDSPKCEDVSSFTESSLSTETLQDVKGSVEMEIWNDNARIAVKVIRCKDLYRPGVKHINAYVKVALSEGDICHKVSDSIQRTAVQGESSKPFFNHIFHILFPENGKPLRLHVEVWHRDRYSRTSEFLGCTSFDVSKADNAKEIRGWYRLLPESLGRHQSLPIAEPATTMCESQGSVEEVFEGEVDHDHDLRKTSSKSALTEQQKLADENIFLRYLELDPLDGPEAQNAATQRKATGNKNGRTPFTHTKRLIRTPKQGFGFSVVWTHPPRIERVEKGLPAERAGILPGDYIIFVDKHNVVMMPEVEVLNLIRSFGNQLTLEIFRRTTATRNGSVPSVRRLNSAGTASTTCLPLATPVPQRRPSTVCSTNTASLATDYQRRKLHLPQVTFSQEKPSSTSQEDNKKRTMYQLISKEQQYATAMQFATTRFVSALAERKDLITPAEHRVLFQNCDEVLRVTEDIIDRVTSEDGEPHISCLVRSYYAKLHEFTTVYKRYCSGIKKADCVLANKTKNCSSEFVRFLHTPAIPRRRPDITTFIHKPLEHYREVLKLLTVIQSYTKSNHEDYTVINQIVHTLQLTYREITAEGGLMEPVGEGRPLLTVQDLENRLVFTKCKPFTLNKPGRQWIFGGDLSRVEGRNIRQYWTLLFSDLLLFAKASRDRVLFIIEEPIPLINIKDMFFNIRKKDTEFRITITPGGRSASSPTVHCGPALTRTPKKSGAKRTVILRAPTTELKAVWQNLLQRQIFHVNSVTDGSAFSSPLESPEVPITSSVATLMSADSFSTRRQVRLRQQPPPPLLQPQTSLTKTPDTPSANISPQSSEQSQAFTSRFTSECSLPGGGTVGANILGGEGGTLALDAGTPSAILTPSTETPQSVNQSEQSEIHKQIDALIEHKCKLLSKSQSGKSNAIHLEKWMKGELRGGGAEGGEEEEENCYAEHRLEDCLDVEWTEEMLRKRSQELQLIDKEGNITCRLEAKRNESRCEEYILSDNDQSPSKSTTTGSQITVRSSPLHPSPVPVCRQCHASCLFNGTKKDGSSQENPESPRRDNNGNEDWLLMGLSALPATSLCHIDPFSVPSVSVPKIAVQAATPESSKTSCSEHRKMEITTLELCTPLTSPTPDDSPQEEHPYHSLSGSNLTLRRYGTVSSLERVGSEELQESSEEETEMRGVDNPVFSYTTSIMGWTAKAGSYVIEKMTYFDRIGEEKSESKFVDRYLKAAENQVNGDDGQEEETSGATSGEEIWGTPTSGGELEDALSSPNFDEKQSPNDGSLTSENCDDTELMMDELLMAQPISGAALRGLLPRRTLEPLIEEDFSESYTSSSTTSPTPTEPSLSPDEDNASGSVADTCCPAVVIPAAPVVTPATPTPPPPCDGEGEEGEEGAVPKIHRTESYRRIVEAAEDDADDAGIGFFNRFRPAAKFCTIQRIPRTKSVKIFEFFNMRRGERRIHETFPETGPLIKIFSKEGATTDDVPTSLSQKATSSKMLKDKQMDRRFWKQLSRRRSNKCSDSSSSSY